MKKLIIAAIVAFLLVGTAQATEGWARTHIYGGSWWYGPYVDFNLLGVGAVDFSGSTDFSITIRYYNDAVHNSNPYGDCPVFLRAYDTTPDGSDINGWRDYGIIWAIQDLGGPEYLGGEPQFPTWSTRVLETDNASSQPFTDTDYNGVFDATSIDRIRFYGTDWAGEVGGYYDFADFKNLLITDGGGGLAVLVDLPLDQQAGQDAIYWPYDDFGTFEVPEPGTMALIGFGLLGLLGLRRRK